MTVKEVFDLRRQGRIEEAYEAIRPMYAQHKGRYTTLCMFWTAADVFKLRLEQGRIDEAEKILEALKRMLPRVEEISKQSDSQAASAKPPKNEKKMPWEKNETQRDGTSASAFIQSATRRLAKITKGKDAKKAPSGAIELSRGCEPPEQMPKINNSPKRATVVSRGYNPPVPASDKQSEPRRGDTIPDNPSHPNNSRPEAPSTTNSQLLTDYPGHMIVSLDEGLIRPREGVSAPQRVVLACVVGHPGYSIPRISESTGIPQNSIERHIAALIEKKLIEHRGSKKTGGYYINSNE